MHVYNKGTHPSIIRCLRDVELCTKIPILQILAKKFVSLNTNNLYLNTNYGQMSSSQARSTQTLMTSSCI